MDYGYGYGRKRGYDDMGGGGWGGYNNSYGGYGGYGGGGGGYGGYPTYPTTSRERLRDSQGRNKMYMQMCNEGTRGEKRRRDADDFDPESKLMRKLFVKNLSPDAKEADLREYFERFGTVETCDIARKPTGECKSFSVDAVQAARPHSLDECELLTKRASLVEDKMTDNLSAKKIFIGAPNSFTFKSGTGGLDHSISDDDLREYFGQFGNITEVLQLYHRDTDRKKGVGFITFDDEDAVDKIVLIGAHIIKGRAIEAQKAITEKSMNDMKAGYDDSVTKPTDPTDRVMRRLFIRRLPQNTTLDDLNEHFSQFGEVVDSDIPIHKKTGLRATYGFVTYASLEQVDECMKSRPHNINDKEVIVRRAMDNELPEFSECKKIFLGAPGGKTTAVAGLGLDISDDELRTYFGEYGTVVSVKQIMKDNGMHKGVGYVEFDDPDCVDKAVLIGLHKIKGRRIAAKKALTEQQMNMHRAKQMEKERNDYYGGGGSRPQPQRGFGSFGDESYFGSRGMVGYRGMGGGGGGMRGGFGRGGGGGLMMNRSLGMGMGVSGMSDYTTDFNGFGGFGGGQPSGFNLPDTEMTPAEREFMMGGHLGAMPSMLRPTPMAFGDAAAMGKKITVEGVKDLSDDMIGRYFSKFGLLLEWTRDDTGTSGTLEYAEAYMVDYCLRRLTHQIDGNEVCLSKTLPKFEDEDPAQVEGGVDEEDEDADGNLAQEGDADDNSNGGVMDDVKKETTNQVESQVENEEEDVVENNVNKVD